MEEGKKEDQSIEEQIVAKGLNAPRVPAERIEAMLCSRVTFHTVVGPHPTSVFVHAYLDDEFYLGTGHSKPISPENFDINIGHRVAKENAQKVARDKLWELEGYRLYCSLIRIGGGVAATEDGITVG